MTSSQHVLYAWGYTHATMAGTIGCYAARRGQSTKAGLCSDRRWQRAYVKSELLVTAGQLYCSEYVPGSCAHRPSRYGSWQRLKPVT